MNKNTNDNNLEKLIFFSNLISYSLSFIVLILYFSFILILGFKPEFYHKTLPESSITYGIFSGLFIIKDLNAQDVKEYKFNWYPKIQVNDGVINFPDSSKFEIYNIFLGCL